MRQVAGIVAGAALLLVVTFAGSGAPPAAGQLPTLPTLPTLPPPTTQPPPAAAPVTTLPAPTGPAPIITVVTTPTTVPRPRTTTTTGGATTSSTAVPTTPAPITTTVPPETVPDTTPIQLAAVDHPSYPWLPLLVTLAGFGTALAMLAVPVLVDRARRPTSPRVRPDRPQVPQWADEAPGGETPATTARKRRTGDRTERLRAARLRAAGPPVVRPTNRRTPVVEPDETARPDVRPKRPPRIPRLSRPAQEVRKPRPPRPPLPDNLGSAIPEGRVPPDDPLAARPGDARPPRRPSARRPPKD